MIPVQGGMIKKAIGELAQAPVIKRSLQTSSLASSISTKSPSGCGLKVHRCTPLCSHNTALYGNTLHYAINSRVYKSPHVISRSYSTAKDEGGFWPLCSANKLQMKLSQRQSMRIFSNMTRRKVCVMLDPGKY